MLICWVEKSVDRDSSTHLSHSKILLAVRSELLTGYCLLKLKWIH